MMKKTKGKKRGKENGKGESPGLRIISGEAKGRRIFAPPGNSTRPTAERVREAIFNILGNRVEKKAVLDIFAGSGAMGIEALSRGAKLAVFADISPAAVKTVHENILKLTMEDRSEMICMDANYLFKKYEFSRTFDLIFIDPPYEKAMVCPVMEGIHHNKALVQNGICVVEHGPGESFARCDDLWKTGGVYSLDHQRKYGKTIVSFFTYML